MSSYDMRRGIIPGVIAGYLLFAYAGQDVQGMTLSFGWNFVYSLILGAIYASDFMHRVHQDSLIADVFVVGTVYGLIWWFGASNVILPIMYGTEILQPVIGPNFYGHIIFGQTLVFLVAICDYATGVK